jgi:hypothetical protein
MGFVDFPENLLVSLQVAARVDILVVSTGVR